VRPRPTERPKKRMLERLLAKHGREVVPWFTADEAYVDNPGLTTWLDEQALSYVMAVSCDARFGTPTGPQRADWPPRHPARAGRPYPAGRAAKGCDSMTGCSSIPVPMSICCWCAARSASHASWPSTSAAAASPCPNWSASPEVVGA